MTAQARPSLNAMIHLFGRSRYEAESMKWRLGGQSASAGRATRLRAELVARLLAAIDEARIAESGADGEDAPALHVLRERHLAQPLDHRIVVKEHGGLLLADGRNGFAQGGRKMEIPARPVARKVLHAAIDRAVLLDEPRTADADEGRELEPLLVRECDELFEHLDQA